MPLPARGLLDATAPPEAERGQGGADEAPEMTAGPKAPRVRRKKAAASPAGRTEEVKLFLTEDIRFRLRMLAFKKGQKISEAAIDVLDKALPKWNLERAE
jgi:hypothetical protein